MGKLKKIVGICLRIIKNHSKWKELKAIKDEGTLALISALSPGLFTTVFLFLYIAMQSERLRKLLLFSVVFLCDWESWESSFISIFDNMSEFIPERFIKFFDIAIAIVKLL